MIPRERLEAAVQRLRAKRLWLRLRTAAPAEVWSANRFTGLSLFVWRWHRLAQHACDAKLRALEARLRSES